jgi:hypothetical protein
MPTAGSRRDFLATLGVLAAAHVAHAPWLWASTRGAHAEGDHPTPRPGITSEKVPKSEELADTPDAIPAFDMVRTIPEVVDGIRCNCGCANRAEFYSLLSCYEGKEAMARHCVICQGQGRLAYRLHKEGKTLDEIRKKIDARFG